MNRRRNQERGNEAQRRIIRRFLLLPLLAWIASTFPTVRNLNFFFSSYPNVVQGSDNDEAFTMPSTIKERFSDSESALPKKKETIGYAISITECEEEQRTFLDGAAVLKQSIHVASLKSKYDYKMYAFVHEDAHACESILRHLGYTVLLRPNPIQVAEVRNEELRRILPNHACCGEKEFMKLYVYLLDHPVAVHFDIDVLMLKPLDDLFDLMLDEDDTFDRNKVHAMWDSPDEFPSQIDFLFTRDYNMADPPRHKIHEMGTQGGFLVVRPSLKDYENLLEIVRDGANFSRALGWGGRAARVGRFYGAASVQGGKIDVIYAAKLFICL